MPIAAYATIDDDGLHLAAMVGDPNTARIVRNSLIADADNYKSAGQELGQQMLELCKKENMDIV